MKKSGRAEADWHYGRRFFFKFRNVKFHLFVVKKVDSVLWGYIGDYHEP